MTEYARLRRVMLRSPPTAFGARSAIDQQWRALNFSAPPDLAQAVAQYETLRRLIADAGAEIVECPADFTQGKPGDQGLTLDAIYVRDASIVTPRGIVLCRMGKPARQAE